MALLTGFGNTMEASAMMSRNLTQLGYDISSFFNLPIEQAMLKVQSAVAGELEPVRRIGYDLSQARMKMTAEQMLAADALSKLDMSDLQLTATAAAKGINVTVSTLTQQEKIHLTLHPLNGSVEDGSGRYGKNLRVSCKPTAYLR